MERFFTQNNWVSFEQEPPVDMYIFSDACGTGWGGLLKSPITEETRVVSGRWSEQEMSSKIFEASAISLRASSGCGRSSGTGTSNMPWCSSTMSR